MRNLRHVYDQIGSHATKSRNGWRYVNIALESISFLYLYHLTYVNNPGYQAPESKNGVGNEFYGRNRRPSFYDFLSG